MTSDTPKSYRFAPSFALTAALAISAASGMNQASAQESQAGGVVGTGSGSGSGSGSGQVETLAPITVTGPETRNRMERQPSLDRLPSSIQDTPQGISVVPQELIEEKNIASCRFRPITLASWCQRKKVK